MGDARVFSGRVLAVGIVFACALACSREEEPKPGAARAAVSASGAQADPVASPPPATGLAPADPATRQRCAAICERSRALHCGRPDECMPACVAMASATPCSKELAAFQACLVKEPTAHWECEEETGVAQIRSGYCEAEQALAGTCMEGKMQPP